MFKENLLMSGSFNRTYWTLNSSFFFLFFAYGAFFPLLTSYLEYIGLNGQEIGYITSIGPIITILTQPLWGMATDRYQNHKFILFFSITAAIITSIFFPWLQSFIGVFILIIVFHLFQAPITPLADTIALNFAQENRISYGDIRLWGAIGFAVASLIAGQVAQFTAPPSIFYLVGIAMLISLFFFRPLSFGSNRTHVNIWAGIKELIRIPHFLMFLLFAFFIFGPMNANNYYFGIYYQHIGGTLAIVGFVFLLSSGSEAPVMRLAGRIITKLGLENTLLLAAGVSLIRWVIFYLVHHPVIIILFFFLQGLSIGLFLTAAPQYVRLHTPKTVQVTALTLYTAFGNGIGTFVCNLFGGWIYNETSIFVTYLFLAAFTLVGIFFMLLLKKLQSRAT